MTTISAAKFPTGAALVDAICSVVDARAKVTDLSPELREDIERFLESSSQLDGYEDVWGTDYYGTEFRAYLVPAV